MKRIQHKSLSKDQTPPGEVLILATLAAIQFTHIVDFMIMMPLGPQFIRLFNISPSEFGLLVSCYTFSAAISGFLGAFFLDRFDRRSSLLFLYGGLIMGTAWCAVAQGYAMLAFGRIIAGAFGGMLTAVTFSIIGDVIPEHRRGAASGTVMASFSIASIAGVPFGLYLANHFSNWHAPFIFLVGICCITWWFARKYTPPIKQHLDKDANHHQGAIASVWESLKDPNHQRALAMSACTVFGGFAVIPYISPYMVGNVGLTDAQLPLIYFFGGALTMFTSRWIGKLADRYGKPKMFLIVNLCALPTIFALTNLPRVHLTLALIVTTVFMVAISGRMVPAVSMITSAAQPHLRGSFMSLNSSLQQLFSGSAAFIAGHMIAKASDGSLLYYDLVGWVSIGSIAVSLILSRFVRIAIPTHQGKSRPA